MTEHGPLTVTLDYQWDRTRFELLDSRAAILSIFESLGLLKAFVTPGDGLAIELTDGRQIQLGLNNITIYEVVRSAEGPVGEGEISSFELAYAVGQHLNVIGVQPAVSYQHVIPWPTADGRSACKFGTASLLDEADRLGASDFAFLVDGLWSGLWQYQAEFGVVDEDEMPARLRRQIGRSQSMRSDRVSLAGVDFPAVGTFVDSHWKLTAPTELVALDEAEQAVRSLTQHANILAASLHVQVSKGFDPAIVGDDTEQD